MPENLNLPFDLSTFCPWCAANEFIDACSHDSGNVIVVYFWAMYVSDPVSSGPSFLFLL